MGICCLMTGLMREGALRLAMPLVMFWRGSFLMKKKTRSYRIFFPLFYYSRKFFFFLQPKHYIALRKTEYSERHCTTAQKNKEITTKPKSRLLPPAADAPSELQHRAATQGLEHGMRSWTRPAYPRRRQDSSLER